MRVKGVKGFSRIAMAACLWGACWTGAQAQIQSRLASESQGRQGAASLAEIARKAKGLYALKPSFAGLSEAELARSGAAPAALVKWGQLRNPVGEGFLTTRALSLSGRVELSSAEIIVPMVEAPFCRAFLAEALMTPEFAGASVGSAGAMSPMAALAAPESLEARCALMASSGIRLLIHLRD